MSCNGCRVLRKGCGETCILRSCLHWISPPEAQGNATLFLAKFFGRSDLMSLISAVPESQRPGVRANRESSKRSGGTVVERELARVPGGGGDGSLRWNSAADNGNSLRSLGAKLR
ncbi:hypothetical protein GH714_011584 [Hevea brasiliensis]|uniref:LOB domain-containing protein n=1 Tax=Hevea brasiliensis TaxID=3981 RepID=A0A6A6NGK8_HEVBR|nr:hypothetical protein GH714_011584 [Hevea brasiliensis]